MLEIMLLIRRKKMTLFNGVFSVTNVSFLMLCLFVIVAIGYGLGRITIKGVNLGTAGVFIVALLFGCFFFEPLMETLVLSKKVDGTTIKDVEFATQSVKQSLKIIENFGLILFVTSVGFIAGPKFFGNLKKNFKSYILLGVVIILAGGLSAIGCIYLDKLLGVTEDPKGLTAMVVGLLSGSLTSTPAFSAAKATVAEKYESLVSVGHGIAYIFGVVGVVLFVQLVPKFMKANMAEERAKLVQASDGETKKKGPAKLLEIDGFGFAAFAIAAILGIALGSIKIPLTGAGFKALVAGKDIVGTTFALTTTGGCLMLSLVLGHFGRIGKISLMPQEQTLKIFRELGLMMFLVGAGLPGGAEFIKEFYIWSFV